MEGAPSHAFLLQQMTEGNDQNTQESVDELFLGRECAWGEITSGSFRAVWENMVAFGHVFLDFLL